MARNDAFFLKKWISYYGKELGEENLYLFLDGEDQSLPYDTGKVNVVVRKRVSQEVTVGDRTRIGFLNEQAHKLLEKYDLVIGGDADELLVVDPKVGKSLVEYLSTAKCKPCISGLGIDVGQHLKEELPIDDTKPFLSQRKYALMDSQYTKPVVVSERVHWGAGFHRVKGRNYRIDKNLYLFHFGSVDEGIYKAKFNDQERISEGWTKHMNQRYRTIRLVTNKKALDGDKFLPVARFLQTLIRHPFMCTRPYMYFWKMIIRIPERFSSTV
jgi:hypothetical protein